MRCSYNGTRRATDETRQKIIHYSIPLLINTVKSAHKNIYVFLNSKATSKDLSTNKDPGENYVALKTPSLHRKHSECGARE